MISIGSLLRGPLVFGLLVVVLFFGGFVGWAATAPLDSGTNAPGVVSPDTSLRVIQHLEGGIISQVLVHEGERVSAGQTLMVLEDTQAQASYSARREEWTRLMVIRARLEALELGAASMSVPSEIEANSAQVEEFIKTQQRIFDIKQSTQLQQAQIYDRQVEQLGSEIESISAVADGLTAQLDLIAEEIADKADLVEQQLISRSELLLLQRQAALLKSQIASNSADAARARQNIEEVRLTELQASESFRDDVAKESISINNQLAQLEEEMKATGDVLRRTDIVSPADGIVFNIRLQTPGGVIRSGEPIMDIVPSEDDLIIVARVSPRDIDIVKVGLPAKLMLVPFSSRGELPIHGEVVQVAADSSVDERSGQAYYAVRIRVSPEELAKHHGVYLAPGMPAEVTVVTGARTMLEYLAEPLVRSVQTAFVSE